MKVITIESLKGTGKSLLIEKVVERSSVSVAERFSHGDTKFPRFVDDFRQSYSRYFKNVVSSFGLRFYSNFFNYLTLKEDTILCNRGLLSLPYFGYYGYYYSDETVCFDEYESLVSKFYEQAIGEYNSLGTENYFFELQCSEDEIRRRVGSRPYKVSSDKFFLDHFEWYRAASNKFLETARSSLRNSQFIKLRNETPEDLETAVNSVLNVLV